MQEVRNEAEPEQLQGRRHEARGKVRLAEYPRLRIYTHWSARTAKLGAGYFAFPTRLPFTPLTRTNGVASSDSPMTSWAAEQRSSAIAWLVTLRMLPNRSSFPRRSTTASRPAAARATPVVPRIEDDLAVLDVRLVDPGVRGQEPVLGSQYESDDPSEHLIGFPDYQLAQLWRHVELR